jgi:beta-phosphoglucomutase
MAAIGIARANDAGLLAAAHADIVVTTLDDIDLSALANGHLARPSSRPPDVAEKLRPQDE